MPLTTMYKVHYVAGHVERLLCVLFALLIAFKQSTTNGYRSLVLYFLLTGFNLTPVFTPPGAVAVAMDTLYFSRWGIQRPKVGPNQMIEESGRIPLLDLGTIAMIKKGKNRVLPVLLEILPNGIRFAGGETHPFEFIMFATRYTPNLGNLINDFGEISDFCGRPHRFGQGTGITGLYFGGFKHPPTGALREIAIDAPWVAKAIRKIVGADRNTSTAPTTVLS